MARGSKKVQQRRKSQQTRAPGRQTTKPKRAFPAQHQEQPGLEAAMTPRPRYEAPQYRGVDKLLGQVALITG